uniref:Uncharacterized protein n=1 Tax=Chelydra serpentina TaxID=8475 RepID=A0A8C3RWV6_CHESE
MDTTQRNVQNDLEKTYNMLVLAVRTGTQFRANQRNHKKQSTKLPDYKAACVPRREIPGYYSWLCHTTMVKSLPSCVSVSLSLKCRVLRTFCKRSFPLQISKYYITARPQSAEFGLVVKAIDLEDLDSVFSSAGDVLQDNS